MKVTIDRAGRLVLPKPIRDELGLRGGEELEATVREGRIEIEPPAARVRLVERGGHGVIEPDAKVETLTADEVRQLLERARR
jgi:AbrB family looped-hinge helix DNA binding protein